jgi:hypothetical protein
MENDRQFCASTNMGAYSASPTLRKEREGWGGYRGKNRCFTRGSRDGAPEHWLSGEGKDRPLMGLRPVLINPRTLVRTWGTPTELM